MAAGIMQDRTQDDAGFLPDDESIDTEAQKWITPDGVIDAALSLIPPTHPITHILDPGSGPGSWGRRSREKWPNAHITGVELRKVAKPEAYDEWHIGDFRIWEAPRKYDLIVGNPPYGDLVFAFIQRDVEEFVAEGGYVVQYVNSRLLAGLQRLDWYCRFPPLAVKNVVPRPSHSGDGKTEKRGEYVVMLWKQGHVADLDAWGWPLYEGGWVNWRQRVRPALEQVRLF